jgi:hypothetical protein
VLFGNAGGRPWRVFPYKTPKYASKVIVWLRDLP